MSRILITGGAGYLGSIMCEYLLIDGSHEVKVLDNFRHGTASLAHLCFHPNFRIVRGDVRELPDMLPLIKDAEIVIPLAALVGVDECNKDKYAAASTNYGAIELLMKYCPKDRRILFPMTNSGYGTSGESVCTEESPLNPISLYGTSKCAAEEEVIKRGNYTVFRLATVFGMSPRMRWSLMVNSFVKRAVDEKSIVLFESGMRRNFIHVKDVARAFIWAIENPKLSNNEIFNLGLDTANMTKKELAEKIGQHTEFHITEAPFAKDTDRRDYHVSSKKLYKKGFVPQHLLDEGIEELIKGAQQYKWRDD